MEYDDSRLSPAMRTALFQKPHDRQFIIDLENSILSFMESNAESYQLRPMNSYYRLLSHQVAEFHDLKHALARAHDNSVVIFKGDQFKKGQNRQLLQELVPVPAEFEESSELISPNDTNMKSGRRYRILKREDGLEVCTTPPSEEDRDFNTNSQSDANDSEAYLELKKIERERQYEQRKQEIFDTPKKNEVVSGKDGDGSSPQPSEFETSRYHFNQIDSSPPPQQPHNRRRKNNNIGANKDKRGSYYKENKFNYNDYGNTSPAPYNTGYMMYPTPPMGPCALNSAQFPMMYPAPFPMDGSNGYMSQFMYQPMNGAAVDPKSGLPAGFLPYPFPYQYGQQPPSYHNKSRNMQHHPYGRSFSRNNKMRSDSSFSSSKSSNTQQTSSLPLKKQDEKTHTHQESGPSVEIDKVKVTSDIDDATKGVKDLSV